MKKSFDAGDISRHHHDLVAQHRLRSLTTLVREYLDERPDLTSVEAAERLSRHGFHVTPAMIGSIIAAIRTG